MASYEMRRPFSRREIIMLIGCGLLILGALALDQWQLRRVIRLEEQNCAAVLSVALEQCQRCEDY